MNVFISIYACVYMTCTFRYVPYYVYVCIPNVHSCGYLLSSCQEVILSVYVCTEKINQTHAALPERIHRQAPGGREEGDWKTKKNSVVSTSRENRGERETERLREK